MKQIVVISGKGGTGKTVITGALASLAENKVMADCDVDAADLHLLLRPEIKQRTTFKSGVTAFIDKKKCIKCGKCRDLCRFNAVNEDFIIDPVSCEGCRFCFFICPVGAITMNENISGEWFISETRFGTMVHARLNVAEENSGKLVSLVRKKARDIAEEKKCDWVIIDGAPGIGCPVIASLSSTDLALVVTEPTMSGLHDADRVLKVTKHFNVPSMLIINKYDLNDNMTAELEQYCLDNAVGIAGKVRFDKSVVRAVVEAKTIMEHPDCSIKREIEQIWNNMQKALE